MKYIKKMKEPISLKEYRSTPNANFDSCNKEDIRNALLIEQGSICAYCMQRISNEWNEELNKYKMEIEHFQSQKENPELSLHYNNMLGVCNGNAGKPKKSIHCDKSKGDLKLTICPLEDSCEKLIGYRADGKIYSENSEINNDLNQKLNLNEENLRKNRSSAIELAIATINKSQKGDEWKTPATKKEPKKWKERKNGQFFEYCQVVISFLEKRSNK